MKIETAGYANFTVAQLKEAAQERDLLVCDIRINPFSNKPGFTQQALRQTLGGRYRHFKSLGNPNKGNGTLGILRADSGLEAVKSWLAQKPASGILLLCGCKHASECHRSLVAEYFEIHWGSPVVITHWEPITPAQQSLL